MAKTITGNVYKLTTAAAANSSLRFSYASAPAVEIGGLVFSGQDVVAKVSLTGTFTVVLTPGFYRVQIVDSPNDLFIIEVDDVVETVDIVDIITSAVGTTPSPIGTIPIASSTAYGKVKTYSDSATPRVYRVEDFEDAGFRVRNGSVQLYNADQSKWFPISVTGGAGAEQITLGTADTTP